MSKRKNKREKTLPSKEFLSTGEIAQICSVTPDTVLKWIRAGKLSAKRTPGGHSRIPRGELLKLVEYEQSRDNDRFSGNRFLYCWEYYSESGAIREGCKKCIVYRSRSRRCYEMTSPPVSASHSGLFCKNSCEECEYYLLMRGQKPCVLVVTNQGRLRASLERDSRDFEFELLVADCEYRCSMLVEQFRPDYVIIDCSLGARRSFEFTRLLFDDPRIPFVRIVLAGDNGEPPRECEGMVFALIGRHFTARTLAKLLNGQRTEPSNAS